MSVTFFAWIASIMYGLEAVSLKLTSKHTIRNPWLSNFVWSLFILLFAIPFALRGGVGIPLHSQNILLASVFYATASIFYILAVYHLDVTVLVPLYSFRTPIVAGLGALFLSEWLTPQQYTLIGIIFFFGIVVTMDEKFSLKSFLSKGTIFGILGVLSTALLSIFTKKAVLETSYWDATFWLMLFAQIWMLVTVPLFRKEISKVPLKNYLYLAVIAFAGTIGVLAANKAYSMNVSIASAIIALPLSMILAFLSSIFAPQLLEKHTLKVYLVRFVCAAVMIGAALQL